MWLLIFLLVALWVGLAVQRLIQSHHQLVAALTSNGGYQSNFVDPKPFMRNSSIDVRHSIIQFLINPFRQDVALIYRKKGYRICEASYPHEGKWFLDLPPEILDVKIPLKENLLIPVINQADGTPTTTATPATNQTPPAPIAP